LTRASLVPEDRCRDRDPKTIPQKLGKGSACPPAKGGLPLRSGQEVQALPRQVRLALLQQPCRIPRDQKIGGGKANRPHHVLLELLDGCSAAMAGSRQGSFRPNPGGIGTSHRSSAAFLPNFCDFRPASTSRVRVFTLWIRDGCGDECLLCRVSELGIGHIRR